MNNELQVIPQMNIQEMQTMAKLFAESGMFPNVGTMAKAFIKIQAGLELGIPPFAAMSGIHIIKEKATIGAGLMAGKIKASGKYDYKIVKHDATICHLEFYEAGKKAGESKFTIEQARKAGTQNLDKFPENMLFARAISNGMKWYCPDLYTMPVYTPEEMNAVVTEDVPHTNEATPPDATAIKPNLPKERLTKAIALIEAGKLEIIQQLKDNFNVNAPQLKLVEAAQVKGEAVVSAIQALELATTEQDIEDHKKTLDVVILENAAFIDAVGKRIEVIMATV